MANTITPEQLPESDAPETKLGEIPEPVQKAAQGEKLNPEEEKDALHYFLTATPPPLQTVDVDYETPHGTRKLVFVFRPQSGRFIEQVEDRHRKGEGPFGKLDQQAVDAELVTEAVVEVRDPRSGRVVEIRSKEFLQGNASPVMALLARFQAQEGLVSNIAAQIRGVSGWSPDRVSEARSLPVVAGEAS